MISLTVTAELLSPVHLGAKRTGGNYLAGLGYIPGRALLGAAAWASIDAGADTSAPEFIRRFVSGDVSWGDLHPIPADAGSNGAACEVPMVVPRTAKLCKLFGLAHGYVDSLLRPNVHPEECEYPVPGGICGVGLKRLDGALVRLRDGRWVSAELHRQHRTHLSIGFDTGTARSGYLYSREVLQEGQVFRGQILCDDERLADALLVDLTRLPLAVGSGRSRGYGQLHVKVAPGASPSVSAEEIAWCSERIAAARDAGRAQGRCFTLTAASAWCLREPEGAHARSLTPSWLARVLDVPEATVRVVSGDARSEARSSWDGAAGLPTEARCVVVAGSTFLCSVLGLNDADLQGRLVGLLERGIGAHRLEGLGRVVVNHPLHFPAEANRGQ